MYNEINGKTKYPVPCINNCLATEGKVTGAQKGSPACPRLTGYEPLPLLIGLVLLVSCFLAPGCGGRSALGTALTDARPSPQDRVRSDRATAERDGNSVRIGDGTSGTDAILDPRCPPELPELGDPCAPEGLLCHYERCLTQGLSDYTRLCNIGTWFALDRWDCEPNPPGCPESPPEHESPCDLPSGSVCRWAPGSKANCHVGHWTVWDALY